MEPGIYKSVRGGAGEAGRPAVFLDRDGVVIEDPGYLADPLQVRFIGGSLEAIARLNAAGIAVVVVTNQSGVGRGYYAWADFERVQAVIERELATLGGWLDGTWACAYHEEGLGAYRRGDHPFRKPNPGMLLDAAKELGLGMDQSWMVGDRVSDLEAGLRAGVWGGIFVTATGENSSACVNFNAAYRGGRVRLCPDLGMAVNLILAHAAPAATVAESLA